MAKPFTRWTLDYPGWHRQINDLAKMYELNVNAFMRDEHKQLVHACIDITPPFTKKKFFSAKVLESGSVDSTGLQLSKKAIDKDLHRIFVPVTEAKARFYNNEFAHIAKGATGGGLGFSVDIYGKTLEATHKKYRGKNGRVTYAGSYSQQEVGRWRFMNKTYTTKRAYEKYRKQVWEQIGRLKAGWGMSAQRMGIKLPPWVNRHVSKGEGGYKEHVTNSLKSTWLESSNTVPYNEGAGLRRLVNSSIELRKRVMESKLQKLHTKLGREWLQKKYA